MNPKPWKLEDNQLIDADGKLIVEVVGAMREMVQAVNAHDRLLEACKEARTLLVRADPQLPAHQQTIATTIWRLGAAIAKGEEHDVSEGHWQQVPASAYCTGLEQLDRILVGLVRQYGTDGRLTLRLGTMAGIRLGQQVKWACTGRGDDHIVIREIEG